MTRRLYYLKRRASTAWTPAALPGLVLWLDASQLALADGDPVGTWTDRSGQGHHAIASGLERPTYRASVLNSRPAVTFDGAQHVMRTATPASTVTDNFTLVAIAARSAAYAAYSTFVANGDLASSGYGLALDAYPDRSVGVLYGARLWADSGRIAAADRAYLLTTIRAAGRAIFYLDGAPVPLTAAVGSLDTDPVTPSGATSLGGSGAAVALAAVLLSEQALADADRTRLEAYLKNRYGLA